MSKAPKKKFRSHIFNQFDPDKFEYLGSGSFGVVVKAKDKKGNVYALKRIFCRVKKDDDKKHFEVVQEKEREIAALSSLRDYAHPNLVNIEKIKIENPPVGWIEKHDPCWQLLKENMPVGCSSELMEKKAEGARIVPITVIQSFCSGGSLRDWLQDETYKERDDALKLASQISHGLRYLHYKGIIHRDMKPANIFLISQDVLDLTTKQNRVELTVRIGDFGLAAIPTANANLEFLVDMGSFEGHEEKTILGTQMYWSPELYKNYLEAMISGESTKVRTAFDKSVDIYAFGIIILEMFIYFGIYDLKKCEGTSDEQRREEILNNDKSRNILVGLIEILRESKMAAADIEKALQALHKLLLKKKLKSLLKPEIISLIASMLDNDASKRPTASEVHRRLLRMRSDKLPTPVMEFQVPRANPHFVSTPEVESLLEFYDKGTQNCVFLVGDKGSGKSETILQFARIIKERRSNETISLFGVGTEATEEGVIQTDLEWMGRRLYTNIYKDSGRLKKCTELIEEINGLMIDRQSRWIVLIEDYYGNIEQNLLISALWKMSSGMKESHLRPFIVITSNFRDFSTIETEMESRQRFLASSAEYIQNSGRTNYFNLLQEIFSGTEGLKKPCNVILQGFSRQDALEFFKTRLSNLASKPLESTYFLQLAEFLEFNPLLLDLSCGYISVTGSVSVKPFYDELVSMAEKCNWQQQLIPDVREFSAAVYNALHSYSFGKSTDRNDFLIRLIMHKHMKLVVEEFAETELKTTVELFKSLWFLTREEDFSNLRKNDPFLFSIATEILENLGLFKRSLCPDGFDVLYMFALSWHCLYRVPNFGPLHDVDPESEY